MYVSKAMKKTEINSNKAKIGLKTNTKGQICSLICTEEVLQPTVAQACSTVDSCTPYRQRGKQSIVLVEGVLRRNILIWSLILRFPGPDVFIQAPARRQSAARGAALTRAVCSRV